MNLSDTHNLRKAVLKRRKADTVSAIRESSGFILWLPPNLSTLAVSPKVAPPFALKRPRVSKSRASSAPQLLAVEWTRVTWSQSLRFVFDRWDVAKCIFEDVIYPIDAEWVFGEGTHQHRRDTILSVLRVSFFSYF